MWNWPVFCLLFAWCWAPPGLLPGSGACSSAFSASALLTPRAFVMGCPVHHSVSSGVPGASVATTPVSGAQENTCWSHKCCCCILSEHRSHLYPHPALSGQLGVGGTCSDTRWPVADFRDLMRQEAWEDSQGRSACQQCCPDPRSPSSLCHGHWHKALRTVLSLM